MMSSKTKKIAKIFLRPDTRRFIIAKKIATSLKVIPQRPPDDKFDEWVESAEPFIWTDPKPLKNRPLISIVVPVYNPPAKYLMPMVYSVVNQEYYDNWELILVNASTKAKAIKLTQNCRKIDTRIKVVDLAENKGIAENTNTGLANCSGEFIGLLDHDDTLAPRALYEVAAQLQGEKVPGIIYSDEDKLTEDGKYRYDPHFKPDWSLQLLRQVNYLNHFMVIKAGLLDKVNGYRRGFEGAQDYDLFLRLADENPTIVHIPKILYHWRAAHNSTAQNFSVKQGVSAAGIKALNEHVKRNHKIAHVSHLGDQPGFYSLKYQPEANAKAAIIIMPAASQEQYQLLIKRTNTSLSHTKLPVDFFIQGNNGSANSNDNVKIHSIEPTDNISYIKKSLAKSGADIVILINSAVIAEESDWVEQLSGFLTQNPHVGVVAPLLLEPGEKQVIFDAGFMKYSKNYVNPFQGEILGKHTYFGNTVWSREVNYLSGRVLALKRDNLNKYFLEKNIFGTGGELNLESYKKLQNDGMQAVLLSNIVMTYYGELEPTVKSTSLFNPNLSMGSAHIMLEKNINIPPGGD